MSQHPRLPAAVGKGRSSGGRSWAKKAYGGKTVTASQYFVIPGARPGIWRDVCNGTVPIHT